MQLRPATETDCPLLHTYLCELEEIALDREAFSLVFHTNLANPNIHYIVAEEADHVVGFISCHVQMLLHHVGLVGEIQELYVHPDYRNRQIGRQLIDTITKLAGASGWVSLEVTTNRKRTDTIRFYERHGFVASHQKLVNLLFLRKPQ